MIVVHMRRRIIIWLGTLSFLVGCETTGALFLSTDPCDTAECSDSEHCLVSEGQAICICDAGLMRDEAAGECVEDVGRSTSCDGWHFQGLPGVAVGNGLSDVWGSAPDDVWLGGSDVLLHWDGLELAVVQHGLSSSPTSFWGAASDDLWALCDGICHWDGQEWSLMAGVEELWAEGLVDIFGTGSDEIWVVGGFPGLEGHLLRWNGDYWSFVDGMPWVSRWQVRTLWASNPNDMWVWTGGQAFTHWDGAEWTYLPTEDLELECTSSTGAIWGHASHDVWAVTPRCIFHWDGTEWSKYMEGRDLRAIHGTGPNNIWAAGGSNTAHWDGAEWTFESHAVGDLVAVWTSSRDDVWAVGESGSILHRDEVGWDVISHGQRDTWRAVWSSSPDDTWVVGQSFARWDGEQWSYLDDCCEGCCGEQLNAMWGLPSGDIWAVGDNGVVVHWDGTRWSRLESLYDAWDLTSVFATGEADIWVVGTSWSSLKYKHSAYHWDGSSWSLVVDNDDSRILGDRVWGTGRNDVWISSFPSALQWNGSRWIHHDLDQNLECEGGYAESVMWGASDDMWLLTIVENCTVAWINHWNGTSWSTEEIDYPGVLRSAWTAPSGDTWLVGESTIARWDGSELTSCELDEGYELFSIWGTSDDDITIVTDQGLLQREF